MTDYKNMALSSSNSSNKVLMQGSGSFTVPNLPGLGTTSGSVTIPHGFESDNLIFQVSATTDIAGAGDYSFLPWGSNDARLSMYAYIDNDTSSLVIVSVHTDSSGFGYPAQTVNFTYRLIIP